MSAPTAQPSTDVLFDDIDLREDKSESKLPSDDDQFCSVIEPSQGEACQTPTCGPPGQVTYACPPPEPEKPYEED